MIYNMLLYINLFIVVKKLLLYVGVSEMDGCQFCGNELKTKSCIEKKYQYLKYYCNDCGNIGLRCGEIKSS